MTAVTLALAYLLERPLSTLLNVLLLALGVATIAALLSFDAQFRDRLARDARGVDLVVGAKGSRLQLVLSSVYHIDSPTGNIQLRDARPLIAHPAVRHAIPLSLGDSVRGFRVVGTTPDLVGFHGAGLSEGHLWKQSFEATLGATAAAALGLEPGDTFETSHGLDPDGPGHAEDIYTVTGVLKPTGTVIDRLVMTSLQSIWDVHDHGGRDRDKGKPRDHDDRDHDDEDERHDHDDRDHDDKDEHRDQEGAPGLSSPATATTSEGQRHDGKNALADDDREITALLLSFKSPVAAVTLAPVIDRQTSMMAASPAFETGRLFALLGSGLDVLRGFGFVLMASAALGVFTALTGALEQRRRDIAVLRALGAVRSWVFTVLLCEALVLTLAGTLLGFLLGHGALATAAAVFADAGQSGLTGLAFAPAEAWLLGGAVATGLGAAVIPLIRAGRGQVAQILTLE